MNNLSNVFPMLVACSNVVGNSWIWLDEKNTGGHSLVKKTSRKIKIKTTTLDFIVKNYDLKKS